MRYLSTILLFLVLTSPSFGQKHYKILPDPKNQKPMLVGKCSRSALEKQPFNEWFYKEYSDYKMDSLALDSLKDQWKDIKIVLIMGSWCGDSKREVPRFFKMLDYVNFKKKHLHLICVDREKKAGKIDLSPYNLKYVPTIIIYRGKKGLGRIVENPVISLEKDMLKFIGTNKISKKEKGRRKK